jgi:ribonuclease T2
MWQAYIWRTVRAASVALSFMFLFAVVVFAQDGGPSSIQSSIQGNIQDKRQNASGQFDFYVLALSWSPSYCAAARARHPDGKDSMQCGSRPFAFVVHGLWPQYEKGFPSYCQVPAPKLDRGQVAGALDMMPSPSLVMHEWERHGTCSGLSAAAYFETVRKARATVKIPQGYLDLAAPLTVSPDDVAAAFVKINPGLERADMAVACDKTRLTEVRLCMARDFSFHACPDIARRACKRDKVEMPAVRNTRAAATP